MEPSKKTNLVRPDSLEEKLTSRCQKHWLTTVVLPMHRVGSDEPSLLLRLGNSNIPYTSMESLLLYSQKRRNFFSGEKSRFSAQLLQAVKYWKISDNKTYKKIIKKTVKRSYVEKKKNPRKYIITSAFTIKFKYFFANFSWKSINSHRIGLDSLKNLKLFKGYYHVPGQRQSVS